MDQDRRVEDNHRRGGKLKGAEQGNMSISGYDLDIPVSRESGGATPRHTKETSFHGDFESWVNNLLATLFHSNLFSSLKKFSQFNHHCH